MTLSKLLQGEKTLVYLFRETPNVSDDKCTFVQLEQVLSPHELGLGLRKICNWKGKRDQRSHGKLLDHDVPVFREEIGSYYDPMNRWEGSDPNWQHQLSDDLQLM